MNSQYDYAFREWNLARIGAHVFPANTASAIALERCGFQVEGRLRGFHHKGERFLDSLSYALVRQPPEEKRKPQ